MLLDQTMAVTPATAFLGHQPQGHLGDDRQCRVQTGTVGKQLRGASENVDLLCAAVWSDGVMYSRSPQPEDRGIVESRNLKGSDI